VLRMRLGVVAKVVRWVLDWWGGVIGVAALGFSRSAVGIVGGLGGGVGELQ
jgi:hypothetical protein